MNGSLYYLVSTAIGLVQAIVWLRITLIVFRVVAGWEPAARPGPHAAAETQSIVATGSVGPTVPGGAGDHPTSAGADSMAPQPEPDQIDPNSRNLSRLKGMEHSTTSVFLRRIWLACVIGMAAAIPFSILAAITLVLYANQQLSATDFASVLRLTLGSVIFCVLCAAPKNRLIGTVLGGIAFGVMITLAIAWEAIFGPILCTGIGFGLTVIPRSFVDKMMENQLPIKKTVGVILILSTGVGVFFMFAQLGAKLG